MFATFVLPAPQGCNLRCAYCAVALRGEASQTLLTEAQFLAFLDASLSHTTIKMVSIVGYEPTLPESINLTVALLHKARAHHVRTSVNTNGVNLPRYVSDLAPVVDTVMISLDSHLPLRNDKLRGVTGTFDATVAGIQSAVACLGADRVMVNTLLIPHRVDFVAGMPQLLSSLGAQSWVISPYIQFDKGRLRATVQETRSAITKLSKTAARFGVTLFCADEFRVIGEIDGVPAFNFQRPGKLGDFVYRLAPDGSCSVGPEILSDSVHAAKWNGEQPEAFLNALMTRFEDENRLCGAPGRARGRVSASIKRGTDAPPDRYGYLHNRAAQERLVPLARPGSSEF